MIVTSNLKDFPPERLSPFAIGALETVYDHGDEAISALEELGALESAAGLDIPDYSVVDLHLRRRS